MILTVRLQMCNTIGYIHKMLGRVHTAHNLDHPFYLCMCFHSALLTSRGVDHCSEITGLSRTPLRLPHHLVDIHVL